MICMLNAALRRQVDGDGRPRADGAGDVERATMKLSQLEGKLEAMAAGLRRLGVLAAPPRPGLDRRDLLLGHADAGVGNGEAQTASIVADGDYRDAAPGRGELDAVGDE